MKSGEHAIVIGASMGGLLAARALADHYTAVTVLERDAPAGDGGPRKGVPQGRHAHGLLARGREVMEALFPGLTQDLVGRGALRGDIGASALWFNHGGYLCSAQSGMEGLLVSRPLLEATVRRRLLELPRIRALEGTAVLGLLVTPGGRVEGVRVQTGAGEEVLRADLVVDASGRGSQSPAWLAAAGFAPPREERVQVDVRYTTRHYRRLPGQLGGKRAVIMAGVAPSWRGGVALAQEGDRWIVSLGGCLGDEAPADEAGFEAFARSLPASEIHEIVRQGEPLSGFTQLRYPASTRRRYERLTRFPEGYLVTGDALCSFNPLYGQGMTVAALEADALGRCVGRGADGLPQRFFREAARIIDTPWQIVVGSDLAIPGVQGDRSRMGRALHWYIAKLYQAAGEDAVLARTFLRVANLIAPPSSILKPQVALRVLLGSWRGKREAGAGREPALS
jgi:2-polyprenyl-6-methoxyphenol hydroxylase-like FAD-dependent oxidoreductase